MMMRSYMDSMEEFLKCKTFLVNKDQLGINDREHAWNDLGMFATVGLGVSEFA